MVLKNKASQVEPKLQEEIPQPEVDTPSLRRQTQRTLYENLDSPLWLKPGEPTRAPHSELAMHCRAAGCEIVAFVRTGNDYAHIAFKSAKDDEVKFTHGLMSEVLPYGSRAWNTCKVSAIVPPSMVWG